MDIFQLYYPDITNIIASGLLGMFGQSLRIIVGIKKEIEAHEVDRHLANRSEKENALIKQISESKEGPDRDALINDLAAISKPDIQYSWSWFNWPELLISLLISFPVGVIVGLSLNTIAPGTASSVFLLSVIASGYAGTDLLEGLMRKYTPATQK